jgi:hypothetical protein
MDRWNAICDRSHLDVGPLHRAWPTAVQCLHDADPREYRRAAVCSGFGSLVAPVLPIAMSGILARWHGTLWSRRPVFGPVTAMSPRRSPV